MAEELEPIVPYFINFAITIAILVWMLRAPFRKFLYQRHERVRDSVNAAALAYEEANRHAEAAKRALSLVASDEREFFARDNATTEQEKKEIIKKAQAEALRVAREAERLSGAELDAAADRLRDQFLDLVVQEAESSLRRGLKKEDHSAIVKRAQMSIEVGV